MMRRFIIVIMLIGVLRAEGALASGAVLTSIRSGTTKETTRVVIDIAGSAKHTIFSLESPPRIAIDFEHASWEVAKTVLASAKGDSIRDIRFGFPTEKTLRVVMDLTGNAVIENSFVIPADARHATARLVIDFALAKATENNDQQESEAPQSIQPKALMENQLPKEEPKVSEIKTPDTEKTENVKPVQLIEEVVIKNIEEHSSEGQEKTEVSAAENIVPKNSKIPTPRVKPKLAKIALEKETHTIDAVTEDTVKNLLDDDKSSQHKETRLDVWLPKKLKEQGKTVGKNLPPSSLKRALASEGYAPVIVIDAGHGGVDPGAIGRTGIYEKQLTLLYAKALKEALEKEGKYKVVLTRSRDEYISLQERVNKARSSKADVFISLHADSHPNANMRGLSVYTLSDQASDREAAVLATHANKGEKIDGVALSKHSKDTQRILIDMVRRDTINASGHFAELLVKEMGKEARLLNNSHRFAGFVVLTSADVPSVLVELGYLSNPYEEKLMRSKVYKDRLIRAMVEAIANYFDGI